MPGSPASYRIQTGKGGVDDPFVVPYSPKIKEAIDKLGQYEDIGLEPEEIARLLIVLLDPQLPR